jgi:thiaminase (transcriptional activator TenA)
MCAAAEWMYLTWCSAAHKTASERLVIREWVALHAGGSFAEQVAWVRAEIDASAPRMSAARKARLATCSSRHSMRRSLSTTPPTIDA